jgi:hypothetical protein
MTLMVINKDVSATAATINLVNVVHRGSAQVWQLTAANAINRLPDVGFSGNSFAATLPPQSITLFVVPAGAPVPTAPGNLRVIRG